MADPLIDDVVLLCHFNGTNGSTTLTDSSPEAHTLTAAGTAAISTTESKWGGASLRIDGTSGACATVPSTAVFGFGTRLWTVEAWVNLDSVGAGTRQVVHFEGSSYRLACQINWGEMAFYDGVDYFTSSSVLTSASTWYHVAWCYDGTNLRAFVDGALIWTNAYSTDLGSPMSLTIGTTADDNNRFLGYIDDLRVTIDQARYTAAFTAPTAAFDDPSVPGADAYVASATPLGALLSVAAIDGEIRLSHSSPLGAFAGLGESYAALLADSGPLGAFRSVVLHDFTNQIDPLAPTYYVMDLETPGGLVRVPISSWQATIQTDEASYVQCVVPACAAWVEDLNTATEFVISRIATTYGGARIEYEMARSELQTLSLAQGPTNYSATLSGYPDALTAVADPPVAYDRTLEGVRTIFVNGANTRARSSIDWLLRPGHRAYADSSEIIVDFISYYVGGGDAYMDVGERA